MTQLGRHHLRHAVYLEPRDQGRRRHVHEIAAGLARRGITTRGRPVQAISDALRQGRSDDEAA